MSNLFVKESYIDRTRDACYGETDVYETAYANLGDLYRALAKEYGRCTGKVHVDLFRPRRGRVGRLARLDW